MIVFFRPHDSSGLNPGTVLDCIQEEDAHGVGDQRHGVHGGKKSSQWLPFHHGDSLILNVDAVMINLASSSCGGEQALRLGLEF